jgi:hypothetical protein
MAELKDRSFSEQSSSSNTFEGNVIVSKRATDNGLGAFVGVQYGSIAYDTGVLTFKPTDAYTINEWDRASTGGSATGTSENESKLTEWRREERQDTWGNGSLIRVRFVPVSGTPTARSVSLSNEPLRLRLAPVTSDPIVPGSVLFEFAGKTYADRNGTLVTDIDPSNGSATNAGTIDYSSGQCELTFWDAGFALEEDETILTVRSLLTSFGEHTTENAFFRTAGSPIRPASLYVQVVAEDGELLTGFADQSGVITGTYMRGQVEQEMGVVSVEFGEMVDAEGNEGEPWYDEDQVVGGMIWRPRIVIPSTLRYNCVVLSNLPLNADILGLDPVRLPSDGRVPIFRPGDVAVVHHTDSYELPDPAVAGATYSVGRTDLSGLWLVDANNAKVSNEHYVVDLAAGTVTMAADLDLGAIPQPLQAKHRIEQMVLLADVQISGQMSITAPLTRDFPEGSLVSSALLFGDLNAQATNLFDQATWTGEWSDQRIGSQATGEFNTIDYPVEVLNSGAVTERWRLNFTSSTAFQIVGENLGVIGTGTTSGDVAPVNPVTGENYFVMRAGGFGAGWSAGNQIRFNTRAAAAPIWIARTVLPGATLAGDSLDLQLRGDVDA